MKYSKDGYKRNSKDKNNPYNIIPSGNITMEGVDFPVFGMDNLGNSRVMMPGANYTFPGNSVFEIPLAQTGEEINQGFDPEMMFRNKYNTELTENEFNEFIKWVNLESARQGRDIMMDMGAYDIQGFWKSGDYLKMDEDNHGSDKWKKPNHPTFSNQSIYHNVDGFQGGTWQDDGGYIPSEHTKKLYDAEYYNWLFGREPHRPEYLVLPKNSTGGWLKNVLKGVKAKPKPNDINFSNNTLKTTGPSITYKDVVDFNQVMGLKNPFLYGHGTGSASLPGIVDFGGLGLRDETLPMTGELGGLGINRNHINDTSLSAVPFTNLEMALGYSRWGTNRDYLNEYNKFIDKINSGLFDNEEQSLLFGKDYSKNLKEIKRKRLEAWHKADDKTKLLLEENYPMLFGFNLQKNQFGDDRILYASNTGAGNEIGIRGGVNNKEISNIFVPKSRIGITQDTFGNSLGDINIGALEEFVPKYFDYKGISDWGKKIQMDDLNKSLLPFKQPGGENTNFNQEEEFKLYNWSNPGIGDYNYGPGIQYIPQPNQFVRPIEKDSDITNIDYLKATNPFERDMTSQRQFLIDQMKSPLMRDRYRENFKLVTGEYPSEEELNTRLNAQISNSELQPNFYLEGQYVNYLPNNYWAGMQTSYGDRLRETSPLLRPYDNSGVYGGLSPTIEGFASGQMNYRPLPLVYNDIEVPLDPAKQHIGHFIAGGYRTGLKRELAELAGIKEDELPKDPEKLRELALQHNLPIGDQYKYPNIFSGVTDSRGRSLINKNILIPHELGHSFNSGQSPFFRTSGLGKNTFLYNESDRRFNDENLSLLSNYDFSGQIYKDSDTGEPRNKYQDFIINDLFGGGISTDDFHAAAMSEISSAKQETVYDMANRGLWDVRGDKPFSSSDLNNMLNAEFMPQWKGGEAEMHLKAMGYTDLLDNTKTINRNNRTIEDKTQKIQQNNNKIEEYNNLSREDKLSLLRQTYGTTDEQYERLNRKRQKGKKYEEAVDLFIKNEGEKYINSLQDEINKNENQINGIQSEIEDINKKNEKIRPEVEEKLDIYFNKLVQNEEEIGDSTFAKYGTEFMSTGGSLFKNLKGKSTKKPSIITNISDDIKLFKYDRSKDGFGISGADIRSGIYPTTDYSKSLIDYKQLANSESYDPATMFLMNEYTIDSAPFKFDAEDWKRKNYLTLNTVWPDKAEDEWLKFALSNKIQGNTVGWKNSDKNHLPIHLTRNFNLGEDTFSGVHGDIGQLTSLLKSGDPYQLKGISSWSVGQSGSPQFGLDRYIIKDFQTDYPALLNEYKNLTNSQKEVWRERELLLDNPTFQVTNIIKNAPRKPYWRITTSPETVLKSSFNKEDWHIGQDVLNPSIGDGIGSVISSYNPFNKYYLGKENPYFESLYDASINDPNFKIKAIPEYGTDIELKIIKKKGGETKSKYIKSLFTKGKMSLNDPSNLINQMLKQGIFKSEFKMGGEQKLNNGYTVKKEFDNVKNIPFISYMTEPDIEGRVYYEGDDTDNINIIDVQSKLNQIRSKHERTKKIILKRREGKALSNAEKQHLNSLGLL